MDFKLNTDFSHGELQCPCCSEMRVQHMVIIAIQCMRNHLGFPLQVKSGYRCRKHNTKVNGAVNSNHPLGLALDIEFRDAYQLVQILTTAKSFGFNGIGIYFERHFVHLDMRPDPTFWFE